MFPAIALDKINLDFAESVKAKPTVNDSGFITHSNTINFMVYVYMYGWMFLATINYTLTEILGSGVSTSGSGYSQHRLCASPKINSQACLRWICIPVTKKTNE